LSLVRMLPIFSIVSPEYVLYVRWFRLFISAGTLLLKNNKLSGQIPEDIGSMTSLRRINLGSNQFDGTIPSSLFELSSLISLVLNFNKFRGSLGTGWSNFPGMFELYLDHNQFTGTLPAELESLTVLGKWMFCQDCCYAYQF
jgi:hypothetical protein